MSDYISRETAILEIQRHGVGCFDPDEFTPEQAERFVISRLKSIPAADVRPVVLCRDCKCYQQSHYIDNHMECARSGFAVHSVDFCSFGEKREETE